MTNGDHRGPTPSPRDERQGKLLDAVIIYVACQKFTHRAPRACLRAPLEPQQRALSPRRCRVVCGPSSHRVRDSFVDDGEIHAWARRSGDIRCVACRQAAPWMPHRGLVVVVRRGLRARRSTRMEERRSGSSHGPFRRKTIAASWSILPRDIKVTHGGHGYEASSTHVGSAT